MLEFNKEAASTRKTANSPSQIISITFPVSVFGFLQKDLSVVLFAIEKVKKMWSS